MARREEALARYAAPAAALSSPPQTAAALEQRQPEDARRVGPRIWSV